MAVARCFADGTARFTEKVLDLVSKAAQVFVPAVWPFELANALLSAERRKRITIAQVTNLLTNIGALPFTIDSLEVSRVIDQVLSLARQQQATVYDAAYLELAMRKGLPLATLDDAVKRAAGTAGVHLIR